MSPETEIYKDDLKAMLFEAGQNARQSHEAKGNFAGKDAAAEMAKSAILAIEVDAGNMTHEGKKSDEEYREWRDENFGANVVDLLSYDEDGNLEVGAHDIYRFNNSEE